MSINRSRILRIKEVQVRVGLGRDSLYRMAKSGAFPQILKIGERASGFLESEVDAFIASRVALRDGGAK